MNTILVVEDDLDSQRAMVLLLRKNAYEVQGVASVTAAKEFLQKHQPDWVLLDLMLPDGDGLDVIDMIHRERLSTQVCVCSGVGDPERLAKVRAKSPKFIFSKPVIIADLIAAMKRG